MGPVLRVLARRKSGFAGGWEGLRFAWQGEQGILRQHRFRGSFLLSLDPWTHLVYQFGGLWGRGHARKKTYSNRSLLYATIL